MGVLGNIAKHEGLALPPQVCAKIAMQSGRNLRRCRRRRVGSHIAWLLQLCPVRLRLSLTRAILLLEAAKVSAPGGVMTPAQAVPSMDWERYIAGLAQDILREQRCVT